MASLQGRIALVTGASQGIGRACAVELARAGATVVLAARNEVKLAEAVAEIEGAGGQAVAIPLDVASEESIKAGAKSVLERFGKVEILVNNAGITRDGLAMAMKRADWDDVLGTNLTGAFLLTQAVLRPMQESLGPDHQYLQRGGPDGAGRTGELRGVEGGADRADAVAGAGGGFARNHRERHCAGIY
jgi:3-oxoacyl-[acyl-carrier protein] reductase